MSSLGQYSPTEKLVCPKLPLLTPFPHRYYGKDNSVTFQKWQSNIHTYLARWLAKGKLEAEFELFSQALSVSFFCHCLCNNKSLVLVTMKPFLERLSASMCHDYRDLPPLYNNPLFTLFLNVAIQSN